MPSSARRRAVTEDTRARERADGASREDDFWGGEVSAGMASMGWRCRWGGTAGLRAVGRFGDGAVRINFRMEVYCVV